MFGEPEFSELEIAYIRMMVPMCISCHSRVHKEELNETHYQETKWRKYFVEMINSTYGGKCCFTKEEMRLN